MGEVVPSKSGKETSKEINSESGSSSECYSAEQVDGETMLEFDFYRSLDVTTENGLASINSLFVLLSGG